MTKKGLITRKIYMRITEDGIRKWVAIGTVSKKGTVRLYKGIPNPGWFE